MNCQENKVSVVNRTVFCQCMKLTGLFVNQVRRFRIVTGNGDVTPDSITSVLSW